MDIVKGAIGTVGSYDLSFAAGKLSISGALADGPVAGSLSLSVSTDAIIAAIEAKVGGTVAKEVLDALKLALDAA
jgi:hypothetical protein